MVNLTFGRNYYNNFHPSFIIHHHPSFIHSSINHISSYNTSGYYQFKFIFFLSLLSGPYCTIQVGKGKNCKSMYITFVLAILPNLSSFQDLCLDPNFYFVIIGSIMYLYFVKQLMKFIYSMYFSISVITCLVIYR